MISAGSDADVFDLGSDFEGVGGSFDFEILCELDGVAGVEFVPVRIAKNEGFCGSGRFLGGPLYPQSGQAKSGPFS